MLIMFAQDLNGMIDAAKYADLVLLLVDASFGFEMETFEFLNILQVSAVHSVLSRHMHPACALPCCHVACKAKVSMCRMPETLVRHDRVMLPICWPAAPSGIPLAEQELVLCKTLTVEALPCMLGACPHRQS